jgi:hypothetical protein
MYEKPEDARFAKIRETVLSQLKLCSIDITLYGKGKAKTVEDLIQEVFDNEAKLTPNEKNELIREISIITAKIIHKRPDGKVLRLKEEKQVFLKDGRERDRSEILRDNAISEKLFTGEAPENGIVRALKEELKVYDGYTISDTSEPIMSEGMSPSFPDVNTITTRYQYFIEFDETAFKADGYVETRKGRTTTWKWVEEMDI